MFLLVFVFMLVFVLALVLILMVVAFAFCACVGMLVLVGCVLYFVSVIDVSLTGEGGRRSDTSEAGADLCLLQGNPEGVIAIKYKTPAGAKACLEVRMQPPLSPIACRTFFLFFFSSPFSIGAICFVFYCVYCVWCALGDERTVFWRSYAGGFLFRWQN